MSADDPAIRIATPVGPLLLVCDPGRGARHRVSASGRLLTPDGAVDLTLEDLATIDRATRRVETDRRRLRRALRRARGPREALRLIPVLVPALERALAQETPLLAYADLVAERARGERRRFVPEQTAVGA